MIQEMIAGNLATAITNSYKKKKEIESIDDKNLVCGGQIRIMFSCLFRERI